MTLQERLAALNWGGEGYAGYEGYGQTDTLDGITQADINLLAGPDVGPDASSIADQMLGSTLTAPPGGSSAVQGTTSGNTAMDVGGWISGIMKQLPATIKAIEGPAGLQQLPGGQIYDPNTGKVIAQAPVLNQGNTMLLLLIGGAIVVVWMMSQRGPK